AVVHEEHPGAGRLGEPVEPGGVEPPLLVEAGDDDGAGPAHHDSVPPRARGRQTAQVDRPGATTPRRASQRPTAASAASAPLTARVSAGPPRQAPMPCDDGGPTSRSRTTSAARTGTSEANSPPRSTTSRRGASSACRRPGE